MKSRPVEIRVGQVWETRDKREAGRRLRVRIVDGGGVMLTSALVETSRTTTMRADVLRSRFRLVSPAPEGSAT